MGEASSFSALWVLVAALMTGAVFVLVLIALLVVKRKQANRGTYSPSRQEVEGSRTDFESTLKVPPEERLIWDTPVAVDVDCHIWYSDNCCHLSIGQQFVLLVSHIYIIIWCISIIVSAFTSYNNAFICICYSENMILVLLNWCVAAFLYLYIFTP